MKNSFSSPAFRLILTSSASNIPQSCIVERGAVVLGMGALSVLGLWSCSGAIGGGFQNIVIKRDTAGTVSKLKCRVSLVLSRQA